MWADHCEDVAFNTYPAAVMPDFKGVALFYCTNMAVSDSKNHAPGIQNEGPFLMMNPLAAVVVSTIIRKAGLIMQNIYGWQHLIMAWLNLVQQQQCNCKGWRWNSSNIERRNTLSF